MLYIITQVIFLGLPFSGFVLTKRGLVVCPHFQLGRHNNHVLEQHIIYEYLAGTFPLLLKSKGNSQLRVLYRTFPFKQITSEYKKEILSSLR